MPDQPKFASYTPVNVSRFPNFIDIVTTRLSGTLTSSHRNGNIVWYHTAKNSTAHVRKDPRTEEGTIAYLMAPPHKGHRSAKRYKSLVNVQVPGKLNCYREDHPDQRYRFGRVRYRREFAQMFLKETCVFSCDDMNKLKVGPPAVS